ncbi:hypothetical protein PtA15_11A583 [Puccinia triticina]|uniref:Mid2 domain-containing protein n=3 Tax=Puccinia triticina TaxID=208348 RepID=A0ABY7D0K6_9BASI|nr:uncharacterized protein PtA15_11A583 [Puccinia triticina]WAQ89891.1 hypothetical protein PtA15_11A583 [Puccinia triticina]
MMIPARKNKSYLKPGADSTPIAQKRRPSNLELPQQDRRLSEIPSRLGSESSRLNIKILGRQSETFHRRAPAPASTKNANNKHDTSAESGSGDVSTEVTATSTTRTTSPTPLATITRDVLPTAVTLVFQVGASSTGTTLVLNSVSTALQSTPTATSLATSITTSASFPSPLPEDPAQFSPHEALKTHGARNHIAPLIGGVVGGVGGLVMIAFAVFISIWLRRRRREREILDMMAPSQLRDPFFRVMRTDPRQSFTWVGPIDKPSSRRGSRLAL